jgi:hypothetical protein
VPVLTVGGLRRLAGALDARADRADGAALDDPCDHRHLLDAPAARLPTIAVDLNIAADPPHPTDHDELSDRIAALDSDPC